MEDKMKKITLALLFGMVISAAAYAEVIMAPQWAEFCPVSYMNAKSSKFNSSSTYWYNRRIQFESSVASCQSYKGDDLKSCYEQVRESEATKNKQWNAKVENEKESLQTMQNMSNTTRTFNTINNLIDKL